LPNDYDYSVTTSRTVKPNRAYEFDVDKTVIFTVWLWKEKADLLELMKNGVTDKGSAAQQRRR
jgi:hypothetical protein